jgi:hypothetical protein
MIEKYFNWFLDRNPDPNPISNLACAFMAFLVAIIGLSVVGNILFFIVRQINQL